ncbi:monocarboxylate transporter 11-like [Ptychodera flava]|uniref:monocarboxylate transporter 11-like n=1 Tax=Ptychodera flava TaxID=63121 RepID=UPI003969C0AB
MTVMVGTISSTMGFFVSAFAPNLEFLYFSVGILVGFGYGLIVAPGLGIVAHFIKTRYVIANALASTGAGVGILIFPPILQKLIDVYGWRGASIVFAGMNAHMFVSAALFITPANYKSPDDIRQPSYEHQRQTEEEQNGTYLSRKWKSLRLICDCTMFAEHPSFTVFMLSSLFGIGGGIYGVAAHLLARAETQNLASLNDIALIVSMIGVGSVLGRLSPAVVSICDRFRMTSSKWFGLSLFVNGGMTVLSYFARSFWAHSIYAFFFGLLSGFIYTIIPQVVKEIISAEMVVPGLGMFSFFTALGGLFGPPCAGLIYDVTSDYNNSFYFYGALSMFGGFISLILGSVFTRRKQLMSRQETVDMYMGEGTLLSEIPRHYSTVATQTG